MLTFDAAQVDALLDYPSLIAALRAAHAGAHLPLTSSLLVGEPPDELNKFLSLVAWAGESIAVKLVGVFPGNLSLPVPEPSVQGLVALFNGATGAPLLVADGAAMTFRKTAANSGLGASFLAVAMLVRWSWSAPAASGHTSSWRTWRRGRRSSGCWCGTARRRGRGPWPKRWHCRG